MTMGKMGTLLHSLHAQCTLHMLKHNKIYSKQNNSLAWTIRNANLIIPFRVIGKMILIDTRQKGVVSGDIQAGNIHKNDIFSLTINIQFEKKTSEIPHVTLTYSQSSWRNLTKENHLSTQFEKIFHPIYNAVNVSTVWFKISSHFRKIRFLFWSRQEIVITTIWNTN